MENYSLGKDIEEYVKNKTELEQNQVHIDYWTGIRHGRFANEDNIPNESLDVMIEHLKEKRKKLIKESFKINEKH